jgi:CheY-like chemotaxis protein
MFVVTAAGRDAWESQDAAVPEQYRRLLWLIDVQGDTRAIKILLREHPEHLVKDWLRELEDLRFLESRPRSPGVDSTIPLAIKEPAIKDGAEAASQLSQSGAYLLPKQPAKPGAAKPPTETTILIVEDDPDQLALADLRVSSANYQVRTATSVDDLMRALMQAAPDLLLLDVMLPDGNGFDVLSKLRRHPDFATLPIVMLTIVSDPALVARGLALGADGYVTKPYSKNILVGVIKGVLG